MRIREKISAWIAVIIGVLFVVAGVSKLANMPRFAAQITAYELMPEGWAPRVAFLVAHAELLLGTALLSGAFPRHSIAAGAGLVGMFALAVAWGWVRGCLEECACFGEMLQRSPGQALAEDIILLAALALAYRWSVPPDPKRSVRRKQVLGTAAVLVAAVVANGWSGVPSHQEVMDAQVAGLRNRVVTSVPGKGQVYQLPRSATIVVFISTRCPHCIRAVPRFNELYTKREQMEFRAFAVNPNARIPEFRRRFGAVFPILQSDRKQLRHLVHGVPEVLLVKDHKVIEAWALPPTIEAVRTAEYMGGTEVEEAEHGHEH